MSTDTTVHFHAGHNMPGYLPEADVAYFEDWDSAKRYMIDELNYAADAVSSWADEHDCDDIPCPTYGDDCPWQRGNELSLAAEDLNLETGPEWGDIVNRVSWWVNACSDEACELEAVGP